jgi:proliferating cell nuclear antigen
MDQNHTALVTMLLRADGFENYVCHRNITLGINIASITKILKCVSNDDKVTIKAEDNGDTVTFLFESESMFLLLSF